MKLAGKLALITGGTDGIGLALARQCKARGANVIVTGRDAGRLEAARAEGLEPIAGDLSTADGCDALIAAVRDRPLALLVNNAGTGADYVLGDAIDEEAVEHCLYLNVHAPIRLVAGLIETLKQQPEAAILNVSSGLAIAPAAKSPVYSATKAALRAFTMAIRAQLAGTRVRVIEALPPVVETRLTAGNPHKKMSAIACAAQIVSAIEGDRKEAMVGQTKLLNLVYTLSPPLARRIMLRY